MNVFWENTQQNGTANNNNCQSKISNLDYWNVYFSVLCDNNTNNNLFIIVLSTTIPIVIVLLAIVITIIMVLKYNGLRDKV